RWGGAPGPRRPWVPAGRPADPRRPFRPRRSVPERIAGASGSAPPLDLSPARRLGSRARRRPDAARRVEHVGRLPRARSRPVRSAPVPRTVSDLLRERAGARRRMSGVRPVAIVTGGTRGIGLGIARALAGDGWDLALCGLRAEDAVRSTLDRLRSAGARVPDPALDVRPVADHERFVAAVHERWAAIDALVNNAGRAA